MHWAAPVKSDPMVEYGESSGICSNLYKMCNIKQNFILFLDPCTSTNIMETPEEDFSETLRKFRNYEI